MIVLPMAGSSSRFFNAGYTVPKYMLELAGLPVFDYALRSFSGRFGKEPFLIIMRPDYGAEDFVRARLDANCLTAELVVLDAPTKGQADTVALGTKHAGLTPVTPLTIFNIDSFRPGFEMTDAEYSADGYLETFIGTGDGWSFVEPNDCSGQSGQVKRVTEKERISQFCCTGLYYFRTLSMFNDAYSREIANPSQPLGEHYIAPMYNHMIADCADVRFRIIDAPDVIFCGVPAEYQTLLETPSIVQRFRPISKPQLD